jgi:hypothetical protein
MNWLVILAAAVGIVIAVLTWGFVRITRRTADAAALRASVQEKDIAALTEECIRVCHSKLGVRLTFADFDNTAQSLDYVLEPAQRTRMKTAFELPDHPGRFVLPLGAFIGEFVRAHHPGACWVAREKGGLAMELRQNDSVMTMFPFDKVLKHAATGKTGEILSYLQVATGRSAAAD